MDENKSFTLYINVLIGAIGTILIGLAAMSTLSNRDHSVYLMLFGGFILVITYINYLEKKAGLKNSVIWARSIGSIVIFLALGYIYFF
ncbi:hypothetical protein A8F94_15065 [Bacillus sp. FJAT-27225]|uniref:hypothetical protein n=1 Tax=Bacillus sp. FJAT-27225 TaxID=1743144 RepID=UPI00080C2D0D|nr:hypothetical protein [Bacillus sp. FJAT-27225]OCA84049.1 hypothetical protein A8F94_15065 [Bacillus sp. FJAT-27225]